MSDHHIHYGTASNPNPYEKDADDATEREFQRLRDTFVDEVTIECHVLPDIIQDHAAEVLHDMFEILSDRDDDKLARLMEIRDREANLHADFKIEQYKIEKGL